MPIRAGALKRNGSMRIKKTSAEELIEAAAKINGWQVNDNIIRCIINDVAYCPLTAVAMAHGKDFGVEQYVRAAAYLGITKKDSYRIVSAADNDPGIGPRKLRSKMLSAFGLNTRRL